MTQSEQTFFSSLAIQNLSVRLRINNNPVGSGFVLLPQMDMYAYILTARHCLTDLDDDSKLDIDWYDYQQQRFITLPVVQSTYFVLHFPQSNSYDGAIIALPRNTIPVFIPAVKIRAGVSDDELFRFRGFPDASFHEKPEELKVTVIFSSEHTCMLGSQDALEDNQSIAYANVQGFSGSGLYQKLDESIWIAGVISEFRPKFKRFVAYTLEPINELLKERQLPLLSFAAVPTTQTVALQPNVGDFVAQCKQLLNQAEQCWQDLRPGQGLKLVQTVRQDLEGSVLTVEVRNALLARTLYLEALLGTDLRAAIDVDALYIEADALVPNTKVYQERAAFAYLNKGDEQKALERAEKLLKKHPHSPLGWLMLILLESNEAAPLTVQENPIYKVWYIVKVVANKDNNQVRLGDYHHLFKKELDQRPVPTTVTRETIYYWSYLALLALHEQISKLLHLNSLQWPKALVGNTQLNYAAQLLRILCERVEGSELRNERFFQMLRFEYCYCQYFLTEDPATRQLMIEQLVPLFIGNQPSSPLPFSTNRPAAIEVMPHRSVDLLQMLHHEGRGQQMLDVLAADTQYQGEPIWYLFRGMACRLLGQREEQLEALRAYLVQTENLDEMDVLNFLEPIRILFLEGTSLDEIHRLAIEGKQYQIPYAKPLLEAFLWSFEKGENTRSRESAQEVQEHWNSLPLYLKQIMTRVFMTLGDWKTAKDYLADLCHKDEESEELLHYIHALYEEHSDVNRFLTFAAHWRSRFTPQPLLISDELNVYRRWRNYAKIEEVAGYGLTHFTQNVTYWWDLVRALFQQRPARQEVLLAKLADDQYIFHPSFTLDAQFTIAHICLSSGLVEKGVEVAYQALMANRNNPRAADAYFMLSTRYSAFDELPTPLTAARDMVVLIRKENAEPYLIELSEEALQHNRLAQAVVDHQAGDTITLHDNLLNRQETHEVLQLFNKHIGQWMLIAKQADNPYSGLAARSMSIPTDDKGELDFVGFERLLQKIAGEDGTRRKLRVEEQRVRFTRGEIGFSELCASCFDGDPISAWQYATSDQAGGFPIIPRCLQNSHEPDDDTEYVLDFTGVLCLFFAQGKYSVAPLDKRFVVSQFLLDYIVNELEEARYESDRKITQEVLLDQVITHVYPDDYKQQRITLYTTLLAWLTANCRPDYAPERMEKSFMDREEDQDLFREDNLFASSMYDSWLLASRPHRILVTDDIMPHQSFRDTLHVITTEHLLSGIQSALYTQEGWLDLVDFNFRGLTLTADQLYQVFISSLLEGSNQQRYRKATYSFSRQYNPDYQLSSQIIRFIKYVYLYELALDYKRQVAQGLLRRHFIGHAQLSEQILVALKMYVDHEFRLLGTYGDYVKEDIDIALG